MGTSKIEWTDATWNPISGCTKVSAGCQNCYAERMAKRLAGRVGYPEKPHQFDVTLHPDKLEKPLHWRKPRRIFVCSMGDLFHDEVPFDYVDEIFGIMAEAPQHTFQLLTKRPERMLAFAQEWDYGDWLLPNVHFGTSVEDQPSADERIPYLLDTPAAVRFVSIEPMLKPVDLVESRWLPRLEWAREGAILDWVIVGGETGPGARSMDLDWVRDIRDQCQAARVPLFVKQLGTGYHPRGHRDLHGADMQFWPEDLRIRELPDRDR